MQSKRRRKKGDVRSGLLNFVACATRCRIGLMSVCSVTDLFDSHAIGIRANRRIVKEQTITLTKGLKSRQSPSEAQDVIVLSKDGWGNGL